MDGPAPVLFVDDQLDAARPLQDVLDASWCKLVVARSAYDAALSLLREDFAAILVDVRMPDMLGFEVAALIKGLSRTQHVPMLFMTAGDLDERNLRRGYEIGAVDYVNKPIDPMILRPKLAAFCEQLQKSQELRRATPKRQSMAELCASIASPRPLIGSLLL
jgi:DNA-binding response OmpR family regulator